MARSTPLSCLFRLGVLFLATRVGTLADTLRVPEDHDTIQKAIDASKNGDVVSVAPNVYEIREPILLRGKAITLESRDGPEKTTIRMAEPPLSEVFASVVVFAASETETTVLEGFTLTGGRGTQWGSDEPYHDSGGGGIYCEFSASPRIVRCVITGNSAASGGGLLSIFGASPRLEDCVISSNSARDVGGGAALFFDSDSAFVSCRIEDNSAGPGSVGVAGGVYAGKSAPTFEGCTVARNVAEGIDAHGGGMALELCLSGVLKDTTFLNNYCAGDYGNGGGLSVWHPGSVTISRCAFLGNIGGIGGGLDVLEASPAVTGCTFRGNRATHEFGGGGARIWRAAPTFTNCQFLGNWAFWGGGVQCYQATPVLTNCLVAGNAADLGGGGVQCWMDSHATLVHCSIVDNHSRTDVGAGVYCESSEPLVLNSIVWGNSPDSNCGAVAPTLTGEDPLFEARGEFQFNRTVEVEIAGGPWSLPDFIVRGGDYRLRSDSPAIDLADPEESVETDILERGRCGVPDLGAFEHQSAGCDGVEFRRGDVDGDGKRDLTDPIFLLDHLFRGGDEPSCLQAADANDDGGVNLTDAVRILGLLFLGDPDLPEPFQDCGVDPTPGAEISCREFPACVGS